MRKKLASPRVLSVFLLAFVLIGGIFFDFYMHLNRNLENEVQVYLNESAGQSHSTIQNKLNDSFSFLESMALMIGLYDIIYDEEVLALLQEQLKFNLFEHLVIITPDGNAYNENGGQYYAGSQTYFQTAMLGNRAVSEIGTFGNDNPGVILAVPIRRNGKAAGVLGCEYPIEVINQLFYADIFGGKGSVNIAKADGSVITTHGGLEGRSNYFEALRLTELKQDRTVEEICQDMEAGKSGILVFTYQGVTRYVDYRPVGFNDWYQITSVPESVVSGQLRSISGMGFLLLVKILAVLLLLLLYILHLQGKNTRELKQANLELETLTANIPGGVFRCSADRDNTLAYSSEGFVRLLGCTEEQFRSQYHTLSDVIHPADRERVLAVVATLSQSMESGDSEFRIVTAENTIKWVHGQGQRMRDTEGHDWFYGVVLDITVEKRTREEIRLSEERYRLITEKIDSIVYDWDLTTDTVHFSEVWHKWFGYSPVSENFLQNVEKRGLIHSDDIQGFLKMAESIHDGKESYGEYSMRLHQRGRGFVWCKTYLTAIRDEDGAQSRAIGIVLDIDKEKREAEKYQLRAERDDLTGLFNKGAIAKQVAHLLQTAGRDCAYAFLITDIDNFKGVNDTLGHLAGDRLLAEIAQRLKGLFRVEDLVARIGGDEFVVFFQIDDRGIEARVEEICRRLRSEQSGVQTSASIGIALYDKDGDTYQELFKKADIALYEAKKRGKERFVFYDPSLDTGEWTPYSSTTIDSEQEG